jgi:hypothetical protein
MVYPPVAGELVTQGEEIGTAGVAVAVAVAVGIVVTVGVAVAAAVAVVVAVAVAVADGLGVKDGITVLVGLAVLVGLNGAETPVSGGSIANRITIEMLNEATRWRIFIRDPLLTVMKYLLIDYLTIITNNIYFVNY